MNAPTGLLTPDPFDAAAGAVNGWRGRCLASFTRAEHLVTEALISLAETDPTVDLPHLVGERYASLLKALDRRSDAADAVAAIATFQRHDELRSFLCHGVARILLDRNHGWNVVFTLVVLRRQKAERHLLLVTAAHAEALALEVRRDQQRLEARLRTAVPGSSITNADLQVIRTPSGCRS